MTDPSNFDTEILQLRKTIKRRLNDTAAKIIEEEIENILGRVKIIREKGLSEDSRYEWFVYPKTTNENLVEGAK